VRLALTVAVGCATVMVVIVILSARAGIGSASGAPPAKRDGFYGAPMPQ
jgi:hypothetical protein